MNVYLASALIFVFAGFIQGVTGFGSLLFALPLLALFLDPVVAVPMSTLCGLLMVSVLGLGIRRHIETRKVLPIILGALPGVVLGVLLLKNVDPGTFKIALGLMLSAYALLSLLLRPRPRRLHTAWGALAGCLAGAIAAAFSAGGPPVIVYTSLQDWSPNQKRGTLTGFFITVGAVVAASHAAAGMTTPFVLRLLAACAPSIIIGVLLGLRLGKRLNPLIYARLVMLLLLAMGLMLLFS
jgi:hypothetical protein